MSFWLDDDDNDNNDPWLSGSKEASSSVSAGTTRLHTGTTSTTTGSSIQPPSQSQTQSDSLQKSQNLYQCTNCGGNDSYYDDATGTDVCTSCFTQSQVIASTQQPNETDWEDVMGLAARTIGGHFVQHKLPSTKTTWNTDASGRTKGRRRRRVKPEESTLDDEYDESIPLPDIHTCLQGMQCVLQKCVSIVVMQILSKRKALDDANTTTGSRAISKKTHCTNDEDDNDKSDDDDDDDDDTGSDFYEERQREEYEIDVTPQHQILLQSLQSTVKEIWLSYIHAWSIGAEYYGARYPQVRFCFRDLFVSNYQVSYMVRRYIPHRMIRNKEEVNVTQTTPDTTHSSSSTSRRHIIKNETHDLDEDEDEHDDVLDVTDSAYVEVNQAEAADDVADVNDTFQATKAKIAKKNSAIRCGAIQKMIQHHGGRGRKLKGYKEVALLIRPSMTMVATILYLALTKHRHSNCTNQVITLATAGLTYLDVCEWIQTGQLPLMTAYHRLLSISLQQKLLAVRGFFHLDHPIAPSQIEHMSTQLCVACRLRIQPKIVGMDSCPAVIQNPKKSKGDVVRQWEMPNLPYIMARFVATAGLNQEVLDRSLCLIGYTSIVNHSHKIQSIPIIIPALQLSRIDELLAIIAISCQFDPQWRDWIFMTPDRDSGTAPIIPWNDSEIRLIRNGPSFHQYLHFVNQHVLPEYDNTHPNFNHNKHITLLPPKYIAAMKSLSNIHGTNQPTINTRLHINDNDDDDDQKIFIRPCRILGGASAPDARTCKVQVDYISEYYHNKRPGRPEGSNNVAGTSDEPNQSKTKSRTKRQRDEAKELVRKQTRNKKQQFRRTECDEMHSLPIHDFYKGDRCNNDYGKILPGDVDVDQMRLIQYLGYVTNMNPSHIHRSMNLLLLRPPK